MYSCHGIHWSLIVWCLYDVIAYKFFAGLSHVWFINLSPNVYILAVIRFIFPIIFIYLMYFRVFWFVKYFFYFTFVEREFFVSYALPNDAQYKLCWTVANGLFIAGLHTPPPPPPPPLFIYSTTHSHIVVVCEGLWWNLFAINRVWFSEAMRSEGILTLVSFFKNKLCILYGSVIAANLFSQSSLVLLDCETFYTYAEFRIHITVMDFLG
jgi:hypothetical protein